MKTKPQSKETRDDKFEGVQVTSKTAKIAKKNSVIDKYSVRNRLVYEEGN